MKELTIEEKAKVYDEALERARMLNNGEDVDIEIGTTICEYIFPELKESEDERIRNWLIGYFHQYKEDGMEEYANGLKVESIIAWLEKQGSLKDIIDRYKDSWYNEGKIDGMAEGLTDDEKYQQGWHDAIEKQGEHNLIWNEENERMLIDCFNVLDRSDYPENKIKEVVVWLQTLKKRIKQKPQGKTALEAIQEKEVDNSNKVEPKFKNAQWIVWQDKCYKVNYNGCGYELIDQNNLSTSLEYGTVDNYAHLWTIEDAKIGDILAFDNSHIILVKESRNSTWGWRLSCWCHLLDGEFEVVEYHTKVEGLHPATKEQRDTLFSKMKESGYEWDAEKKELKNVRELINDFKKTMEE